MYVTVHITTTPHAVCYFWLQPRPLVRGMEGLGDGTGRTCGEFKGVWLEETITWGRNKRKLKLSIRLLLVNVGYIISDVNIVKALLLCAHRLPMYGAPLASIVWSCVP